MMASAYWNSGCTLPGQRVRPWTGMFVLKHPDGEHHPKECLPCVSAFVVCPLPVCWF